MWSEEWYDGPATGVAEHEGQTYWFTPMGERWFEERPRRWLLHSLSDNEKQSLDERFRDSQRLSGEDFWTRYHPVERAHLGFEAHDGDVVGWFTDTATH